MKSERVKKSIYNSVSNVLIALTLTIISFVSRSIFIKTLGEQLLGLDGLFTNILTLLSLAELGFSSAISFCLYEPLAKNDNSKISIIMNYFRKVYNKIGIIIFVAGICFMPFLSFFVKGYTVNCNIYLIFFLYLVNTASTYFTSYNSVLLEADQKNYKITHLRFLFNMLVYGLQILVLIVYKNFILYLLVLLVFRQIERIITYFYIKNMYKKLDFKVTGDLDKKTKDNINKNIKGILFHKVGEFVVNGTDNILISSIINISTTGLYANYLSVTGVIKTFAISLINSTTSTFGNLNVEESAEVKENVFNVINLVSCFFIGLCVLLFYFAINDFIMIWIGAKYILGVETVVLISINLYLTCILLPVNVVKNSTGLYYIDRYVGLIQAFINLAVSVILGKLMGLNGILLGTTISYITTVSWSKAYVIYKRVFQSSFLKYIKILLSNVLIMVLAGFACYSIFEILNFEVSVMTILIKSVICAVVFTILYSLAYCKTNAFRYVYKLLIKRGEN